MRYVETISLSIDIAVAESDTGVDGFHFWDYPVVLPDTCPEETNVYDMRLTKHEDGWIYGVFCSESKDTSVNDLSAAVAAAGIVRTKDLKTWERLDNLITKQSPQQRNVVLHPEFVRGKYAFYTRPMDDFIDTAAGLRNVLYSFAISIDDPVKVIAEPSGLFLAPLGDERAGDVSNVVFNTPEDPRRSPDCVKQRCELIKKNLTYLKKEIKQ